MIRLRILLLGLVAAAGVAGLWFFWRSQGADWRDYEALGVLFSGLAFVGLVVTVLLQLTEIKSEDEKLRETMDRLDIQIETHAHAAFLSFAENRITYLQRTDVQELELEGITSDAVRTDVINRLKLDIKESVIRLSELKSLHRR